MRHLTTEERTRLATDPNAALKLVRKGEIQCDRCDTAAQTMAHCDETTDAICYACYPAFHRERADEGRAFVREFRERGFAPEQFEGARDAVVGR